MSTASALDENKVRELVDAQLAANRPVGFSLAITAVRKLPDFWQVAVRPDQDGVRADDYAHVLTKIEEYLRDEQALNIVLTPVLV